MLVSGYQALLNVKPSVKGTHVKSHLNEQRQWLYIKPRLVSCNQHINQPDAGPSRKSTSLCSPAPTGLKPTMRQEIRQVYVWCGLLTS